MTRTPIKKTAKTPENNPPCPECGGKRVWKKGSVPLKDGREKRRYVCFKCGGTFYAPGTPDDRIVSKHATGLRPSVE
jgi:DNA-directed RNA polymerase subunit RPC12/RpoP